MSGLPLIGALVLIIAFSMLFGALLRDVSFAFNATAWSKRAFSRIGLAEGEDGYGIEWEETSDDEETIRFWHGIKAAVERVSWAQLRKEARELPYQRWLSQIDQTIATADRRMASNA